jgi:hypothetical protein
LNGLVLDKKILSLINKIGNERLEAMADRRIPCGDALFREQPLSDALRSRTKRLIELGLAERVSRNKFVLARSLKPKAVQLNDFFRMHNQICTRQDRLPAIVIEKHKPRRLIEFLAPQQILA